MTTQRLSYAEHRAFFQRQQLHRKRRQLGLTAPPETDAASAPPPAEPIIAAEPAPEQTASAPAPPREQPDRPAPQPESAKEAEREGANAPQTSRIRTSRIPIQAPIDRTVRLRLRVESGPDAGTVFPLPEGEFIIGRAPDDDLRLTDGHVSHRHAKIVVTARQATIEDLKSLNGTEVLNDPARGAQTLRGIAVLRPGARVFMGETELVVLPGDQRG
jgi:hypothetical protein